MYITMTKRSKIGNNLVPLVLTLLSHFETFGANHVFIRTHIADLAVGLINGFLLALDASANGIRRLVFAILHLPLDLTFAVRA
jgi:hypothetical protein